jgi:hypothetical protein
MFRSTMSKSNLKNIPAQELQKYESYFEAV